MKIVFILFELLKRKIPKFMWRNTKARHIDVIRLEVINRVNFILINS